MNTTIKIQPDELAQVLERHRRWLRHEEGGERAGLRGRDLQGRDLHGISLRCADLRGSVMRGSYMFDADLQDADLRETDMRDSLMDRVNLRRANMSGANLNEPGSLWGAVGNGREVKSLQIGGWPVTYTATHMQIGCQLHRIKRWWEFPEGDIDAMDPEALDWWRVWKPLLQQIIAAAPATAGAQA